MLIIKNTISNANYTTFFPSNSWVRFSFRWLFSSHFVPNHLNNWFDLRKFGNWICVFSSDSRKSVKKCLHQLSGEKRQGTFIGISLKVWMFSEGKKLAECWRSTWHKYLKRTKALIEYGCFVWSYFYWGNEVELSFNLSLGKNEFTVMKQSNIHELEGLFLYKIIISFIFKHATAKIEAIKRRNYQENNQKLQTSFELLLAIILCCFA